MLRVAAKVCALPESDVSYVRNIVCLRKDRLRQMRDGMAPHRPRASTSRVTGAYVRKGTGTRSLCIFPPVRAHKTLSLVLCMQVAPSLPCTRARPCLLHPTLPPSGSPVQERVHVQHLGAVLHHRLAPQSRHRHAPRDDAGALIDVHLRARTMQALPWTCTSACARYESNLIMYTYASTRAQPARSLLL